MFHRLAASAFALIVVLAILFLVVLRSDGADFNSDWLLEDLTCEELAAGWHYGVDELNSISQHYAGCAPFYEGMEEHPHAAVHCALIKKHGQYMQGMVNDIAAVFNAKPECTGVSESR